jgi:hypothetical protein
MDIIREPASKDFYAMAYKDKESGWTCVIVNANLPKERQEQLINEVVNEWYMKYGEKFE